ncbi:MAG: tRNA lysidine(34) synthetase TilS [Deltaproteobacteria bacterium]|nr:tRNA lysidine(34) synthetase TilS [Deltaproteobacteria bacterium]
MAGTPKSAALARNGFRLLQVARAQLDAAGVRDGSLLVAVSAGGDSLALLELCALAAPRLGLGLCAVYVDHGVRPEAAIERAVVQASAERLGAAFESVTISPDGTDEDSLRRARLRALEAVALARGCRWIALGHTADDQIETIVLRFLRGAGFGGLAGMRAVRGPFVRPLLGLRRDDLRDFLRRRGLAWVEDASNGWLRYARARLRREVLPAIEQTFGAGALEHLARQAPRWREDQDFLDAEALRLEAYCSRQGRDGRVELDIASLTDASPALRSRVLHRWLGQLGDLATPDLRHVALVESLLTHAQPGATLDLPGLRVWREAGRLRSARSGDSSAPTRPARANRPRHVAASPRAC